MVFLVFLIALSTTYEESDFKFSSLYSQKIKSCKIVKIFLIDYYHYVNVNTLNL